MEIQSKIRSLRLERGLTQYYVASELNLSIKTYARFEQGKSKLYFKTVLKLAEVFDISINQMLGINQKVNECYSAEHQSMEQELKFYKEKAQKLESDKIFLQHIIDQGLINKDKSTLSS